MKPIPRKYLPHTAALYSVTFDTWQNPTDTPLATLENVRIEPQNKVVKTKDNTEIQLTALMFYDAKNSTGATTFEIGQAVVFNSTRYTVQSIALLFSARTLHHYEIGLA